METVIRYLGESRFEASARGHVVACDQPVENKGSDTGMAPPEFLLVSLGTCAGYYASQYLLTRSLPTQGLEIRVTAEKAAQPARIGSLSIEVLAPAVEPRHQEGLRRAVQACLIHNTLTHPPSIQLKVETSQPVGA
jgi:putative redox protein